MSRSVTLNRSAASSRASFDRRPSFRAALVCSATVARAVACASSAPSRAASASALCSALRARLRRMLILATEDIDSGLVAEGMVADKGLYGREFMANSK